MIDDHDERKRARALLALFDECAERCIEGDETLLDSSEVRGYVIGRLENLLATQRISVATLAYLGGECCVQRFAERYVKRFETAESLTTVN
jgi:hypothetical protein